MIPLQPAPGEIDIDPAVIVDVLAVAVAAYLLARLVRFVLSGLAERSSRHRITVKMFVPIVVFLVYGGAAYLVLGPLLSLSTAQVLAVSGLLGAALGFGLKDLFAGVIGGLVILTEKPYRIGDKVEVDGHYGEVTGIGIRATSLTTADDTVVRVPNATVFTSKVSNANDGAPEMLVVVEVAVAPGADLNRATGILEDALVTSRYVYVDENHPVAVRVEDDTYYRTLRGKAYVADLRDEFAFASDVTERTLAAFEQQGVETPETPVGAGAGAGTGTGAEAETRARTGGDGG